ncbi:ANTAR domain-containing protein [Paenarthrobacter sp. NPDC089675]|uniref:ANTAR domain-containing protein n=1 Tax=Paenarthrobacter sp. NPDC089675 TaxID=3364376 RepID=UPI0037FCA161
MTAEDRAEDFEQLVDLIAGTEDIKEFLDGLTGFSAAMMSGAIGVHIECAVTLRRRKRTATIGGSSERAITLDRIEQAMGEGPCVDALDSGVPKVLEDAASDPRWPDYSEALLAAGIASALGVPMELGEESAAVLNFFAAEPGVFTRKAIDDAVLFVAMSSKALRLAVRIAAADQRGDDLRTAMESRTVIDLACGMIMAQNRCSHDEAFEILRRASSDRNRKLRDVAQEIVDRMAGQPHTKPAHFED